MYEIIIFEGPDCSGKSTLKRAFEKKTNYRHLCVDRMFITSMVYNKCFERHEDLELHLEGDILAFDEHMDPMFVYVKTDIDVIYDRIQSRGDDMLTNKDILQKVVDEYDKTIEYLKSIDVRILIVDGNDPVDENIERILNGFC